MNEKPKLTKKDNLIMALKYLMCTAGAGIIVLAVVLYKQRLFY